MKEFKTFPIREPFIFWIFSFLSGLLLALSRLPLSLGFLSFFALVPLFRLFDSRIGTKYLIFSSLIFSTVYTAVSLHWICLVTIPGFCGMFILFGFYFSLLFLIIYKLWQRFPRLKLIIFTAFWISFEYVQNFGEFSFPWFNLGYSLSEYIILIQPAEIGGVYLVSILVIILNFLVYSLDRHRKAGLFLLGIFLFIWIGWGVFRLQTIQLQEREEKISIVQVSIPQTKKWEREYADSTMELYRYYSLIAEEDEPAMIIWPESAVPAYLMKQYKFRRSVKHLARELKTDIFSGFPHYEIAGKDYPVRFKFYNSCTKIDSKGNYSEIYYKNILVPFGERIPFLNVFPILWKLDFGQANWEYGTELKYYETGDYKFSPLICFEIAFPILTKKMNNRELDFIVNITNDAWFKRSAGTFQHAEMTKFRAIETRKQVFRAANTGFSLIVSPTGKIEKKTDLYEKKVITGNLITYNKKTIFTKYLPWFPLVFVLGACLLVGLFFITEKRENM